MELQAAPQPLRVETGLERGVALVSLFGTLDMFSVGLFEMKIRTIEVRTKHVVLDLRGLTGIGTSGVAAVLRAKGRSRTDGWRLAVVRGSPSVDRKFSISPRARGLRMHKSPVGVFPPQEDPAASGPGGAIRMGSRWTG
jgi:anti-anti-sigma factor